MRCHSVEALLCKAHRYICQGLLEAWINEFFFNCLWGSILEYWDYFEMKSRKTLWAWNICSIFVGNWNHAIRLTTFVRWYVMYKQIDNRKMSMQLLSGASSRLRHHNYIRAKTRYENSKYDFCYLQRMLFGLLGYSLWSMSARNQFFICHCLAVDTCHSAWRLNLWERR